ncbi:GNS1/SUR4 family protein-like protein [Cucurbitaria berberidis CBS 394.84]|uniref:Elongation of fatty acids protein n=1 Tax=Cucurbitaria berberidis CBS 394.84 TaxID=1168544 RepID=A0A9P4GEX3_9PLEO|nr:GNS1/SUR4 family protein-like protein [Cucurbitaria berberidis CBS 394.84]KAF1844231.1 GNS1/SUR4 family protein-like protein [Cucurbitaria berberidis CBS 394.84]
MTLGAGPSLHPGDWPSRAVLKFPPDAAPPPIANPWTGESTFANPFPIPQDIFQAALSYKVPLAIASVYAVTVTYFNWYNRQHGNKAWRIAKTRPFFVFVVFHNVFLAVYSAITCVAMILCLKHSFPHYTEANAVVGTIDALCKIHGPRGLGDAVTYQTDANTWTSLNSNITVGPAGLPDTTDVGRMWNEGLAFWGWWFYLSKFYEVLDTAIILAKGKRSTTLQKYHHAGAMLSMWAGMRFMSPPIWMFVLVNSGIHAMMYTYYTVSAFRIRVPNVVKRTLTTLQITQFLVGTTFAAMHLFISYTVPVAVAYKVAEKVAPQLNTSTIASAITSATDSATLALPTATGVAVAFLRKLIYRAAGDEGLAENIPVPGSPLPVHQQQHVVAGHADPHHPVQNFFRHHDTVERVVYRTEYQTVPCIDTSGQAFAVYLNIIYLTPLTLLFMRFFFKSYLRRTNPNAKHQSKHAISKAAHDASHGVEREIESLGQAAEDGISSAVKRSKDALRGRKVNANGNAKDERHGSMSPANKKFLDNVNKKVSQRLQELDEGAEATVKKAKEMAKNVVGKAEETKENVEGQYQEGKEKAKQESQKANDSAKQEVKKDSGNVKEEQSGSRPGTPLTPQSKKAKQRANKKAREQSEKSEEQLDNEWVQKPEREAEPKDLNNTLEKRDGKGLF